MMSIYLEQKRLRDKHNIQIMIEPYDLGTYEDGGLRLSRGGFSYKVWRRNETLLYEYEAISKIGFKTYENALKAAIKVAQKIEQDENN